MKFTVYQESRLGKRKQNQDRMAWRHTRESLLLVVADGMGGHAHGEVAAQVAVDQICAAFEESATPRVAHPFLFLSRVLTHAHQAILAKALGDGLPESPRTTCVVCLIQDGAAYWAHAGDSRLYLLRAGKVLARTRDHSRVQFLIDAGTLSEAGARTHPERNIVLSCLGGGGEPQISCSRKTPLQDGDVVVLCTDGAWAPLEQQDLAQALGGKDIMASVPAFLNRAEAQAGPHGDNATLIALHWESTEARADANSNANSTANLAEPDAPERRQFDPSGIDDETLAQAIIELRKLYPFEAPSTP